MPSLSQPLFNLTPQSLPPATQSTSAGWQHPFDALPSLRCERRCASACKRASPTCGATPNRRCSRISLGANQHQDLSSVSRGFATPCFGRAHPISGQELDKKRSKPRFSRRICTESDGLRSRRSVVRIHWGAQFNIEASGGCEANRRGVRGRTAAAGLVQSRAGQGIRTPAGQEQRFANIFRGMSAKELRPEKPERVSAPSKKVKADRCAAQSGRLRDRS